MGGNYVPIAPIVIDKTKIEPLSPSLNSDKTKNRINMLFYRSDPTVNIIELKTAISRALKDNKPINYYTGDYGVFDIEPFRSNMDKFNFWIYTESVATSQDYNFRESVRKVSTLTGLDFVTPMLVEERPELDSNKPFSGRDRADLPDIIYTSDRKITEYVPGGTTSYYYGSIDKTIGALPQTTLAHEMGHSIFGLKDEYIEQRLLAPTLGYPNCASSAAEAQSWWGDYIGQVDPFFFEYRDGFITGQINSENSWLRYDGVQLQEKVFDPLDPNGILVSWKNVIKDDILSPEELRTTQVNRGGCFAGYDNKDAWRPSQNSIMNGGSIFDSYNRAVGQKILDLFNKATPPTKPKFVPDYYNDIKNFQVDAVSPANCQVVIQGDKKTLNCTFENQNMMMSDKVIISYGIREFDSTQVGADDQYTIDPKTVKMVECKLVNGVSKFNCQGLDITNLDSNKQYIIGLGHNAIAEFGTIGEEYDGRVGTVNRAIQNYKTGFSDGGFKLTSLETIIIPEIKPIMTLTPTPASTLITPVSTQVSTQTSTPITAIQKTNPSSPLVRTLSKTGTNMNIVFGAMGLFSLSLITITATFLQKRKIK